MKELTIEEKAKAYDEALKRAIKHRNNDGLTLEQYETIDVIFPELKESEEEKIRKELMDFIYVTCFPVKDLKKKERFLDWLEKQGEPKEYTFKSIPRLLDMIEPTERAKAYTKKLINTLTEEGYITDAKIVEDCLKQMNGEVVAMAVMDEKQGEQKPYGNNKK